MFPSITSCRISSILFTSEKGIHSSTQYLWAEKTNFGSSVVDIGDGIASIALQPRGPEAIFRDTARSYEAMSLAMPE